MKIILILKEYAIIYIYKSLLLCYLLRCFNHAEVPVQCSIAISTYWHTRV